MSSAKKPLQKSTSILKLIVPAGKATPTPPLGPAFGQKGVKAMDFCKQFNDQTQAMYLQGIPLRVRVKIQPDRSFTFSTKPPPTSWFLKQLAGVDKGSSDPGNVKVGNPVSLKAIYEVAKLKHPEMNMSLQGTCKSIVASARSAGIDVVP